MDNKEQNKLNPETANNPENERKLAAEREKHLERLKENRERSVEDAPEKLEDVQHEAQEKALSKEDLRDTEPRESSPAERRNGPISKAERDASFKAIMEEERSQMSAPSRAFSRVIHNKTVEKASETVGATVARPNAILSGAIFAFILTLGTYLIAKNLGYPLSGFETIAAFALGWLLGIAFDFLKVMVTGKK